MKKWLVSLPGRFLDCGILFIEDSKSRLADCREGYRSSLWISEVESFCWGKGGTAISAEPRNGGHRTRRLA